MKGVSGTRMALGSIGVLGGLYGAYLYLSRLTTTEYVSSLKWLIGGVIVHDGFVAAAAIVLGFLVTRIGVRWVQAPLAAGMIVLATVTVVGIPMIGRFGERTSNPTLLDRNYTHGWLIIAALVVVGTVLGMVLARRRDHAGAVAPGEGADTDGPGAGGRRRPDGP